MRRIFADRIRTAKELNRRSGAILREARRRPVTIVTEGHEPVVIEHRDVAAADAAGRWWLVRLVPLIASLPRRDVRPPREFEWIDRLSAVHRRELARELPGRVEEADRSGDFESLAQYLYEWEVTSEVDSDPLLRRRLLSASRARSG